MGHSEQFQLVVQGGLLDCRAQLQHGLLALQDVLAARGAQRHRRLHRRLRPAAGREGVGVRCAWRGAAAAWPGAAAAAEQPRQQPPSPQPRPLAVSAPPRAPQSRAARSSWSGVLPSFPRPRSTPPLPPQPLSPYEVERARRIAEINADPRCAQRRWGLQRS
jgi:hypothetical protein